MSAVSLATQRAIQKARQLLAQNPVFLDTETTGLDRLAEIVEIAIVDANGAVLFESLVRPTRPIPADAFTIHGISNDMVRTAPLWNQAWTNARQFVEHRMVAIYNAEFDLRLMQQSMAALGGSWNSRISFHCLMKLYAEFRDHYDPVKRGYKWFSLEDARRNARLGQPNSHRAVADSQLARAVLYHIAGEPLPASPV